MTPLPLPTILSLSWSWCAATVDTPAAAPDDTPAMVDPADLSDIRATLHRHDGDAYARLVRRHQQSVAGRMRRFARNDRATLEELTHDVFVEAYLSLPRYRGGAPFDHWLAVIATRVGYRHWKRQSAHRPAPLTGSEPAPDSPTNATDHELDRVLDQLPPRDRLVLTLLYLEDRSTAEAARLTGWSQTMVKVQAFRARAKLKKIMARTQKGGRP
jgi:RNA polymerase sigma-70 factor (ECF subfamily)